MDKHIGKWATGTIVVPLLVAMVSIFGVQLKDALFPTPPPKIDNSIAPVEKRLLIVETQVNILTEIFHSRQVPRDARPTNNRISDSDRFKQKIKVENASQYSGRKLYVGKKAWDWTIYIDSAPSILAKISCVTYQLHPTFKDPTIRICKQGQSSKAFSYSTTGWGTFNVGVKIEFKDGSEFTTDHYLIFRE